ncbi:phosphate/phosphite/phosphonate ABC transporter substrate-binding protein [Aestuariivirga litoralis]|uniref:phosphate/phosphite/phosphonate ABC transporter substrate-binding protein n=1 Tax=Aestuariivirga litoralis TaxID=2650924 RepID=UPI0018C81C00|nr:PhnD/SsuA/transferrin family substrate-binding protein [Aestuariivirga litoralis]MBG1232192.1 PhnD/SsuA/transferrin family substrate-binding protein [Aestuariivirga litoralis]
MIVASPLNSLPMYDWPEVRDATNEFWTGLARHLGTSSELQRGGAFSDSWCDPHLFFSQTCGYPFTHEFNGVLNYVATPTYGAPGCGPGSYSSFIFAREKVELMALRGARPAINSMDSMSGMLALRLAFAPGGDWKTFFAPPLMSGAHVASLAAVQKGEADVCATDAVCVAMARRYRPDLLEGLVEIARSPQVPALPYVTRAGDVGKLRAGLQAAFADPSLQAVREKLFLKDVSVLPDGAYDVIPALEATL